MCMHYMKFVGVYHIDPATVWLSYFNKNETKYIFFHWDSNLGLLGDRLVSARSPLFSVTICATDLTDFWYVYSR